MDTEVFEVIFEYVTWSRHTHKWFHIGKLSGNLVSAESSRTEWSGARGDKLSFKQFSNLPLRCIYLGT